MHQRAGNFLSVTVFRVAHAWRPHRGFGARAAPLREQKGRGPRGQNPKSASPKHVQATSSLPTLSETEALPVRREDGTLQSFPSASGVYSIYDGDGVLQYMGLTRKLSASLETHASELPEQTKSAKVAVVEAPGREALTEAWKAWMEEHVAASGALPPGNEAGNKTWTERRARRAKPEIRLTPGAHVELNVPLTEIIDKVVKECGVVAFIKGTRTAPQCGFSHRVLTILNENKVDYELVNVLDEEHNPGLREAIKSYSQWPTIPQLYVKGEFVGGADILDEMVQTGEIKELFARK